jgi:hypothetical protein
MSSTSDFPRSFWQRIMMVPTSARGAIFVNNFRTPHWPHNEYEAGRGVLIPAKDVEDYEAGKLEDRLAGEGRGCMAR